jgi:oligopeptide transport system substrate-binding protein
MHQIKHISLYIFILLFTIASCVSDNENTGTEVEDSTLKSLEEKIPDILKQDDHEQDKEEITDELVIALMSTELNYDPAHAFSSLESQLYTAIYEGLFIYHPVDLSPVAGAASEWELSDDKKVYRFYLRENAYYSNGDPVVAEDFKISWLNVLDPDENAEFSAFFDIIKGAKAYRLGQNNDPDSVGIRAISDYILEVELEKPAAHFLKLLCHMSFVPVHPEYYNTEGWENNKSIIGNGPYFIYSKDDSEIVLLKNNLYWDSANVGIEKIIFRFYDDRTKISEDINIGNVHWAMDWDYQSLEDTSNILPNPMFATTYLFMKCVNPPWDDYRVRRALALLVPWEEIRNEDVVFFPTDKLIPELPEYPSVATISEKNREEAFRLLSEAGYPDGHGLPEIIFKVPYGTVSESVANVMAEAWRDELGTEVTFKLMDYSNYYRSLKLNDYTIGQMTWIGDFADPLTFLGMWTSESNLNDAGYSSLKYDNLIERGIAEEGEDRYRIFSEAESLILEEAVVLPLSNRPAFNLIDLDYVLGWIPNPLDLHPFKYLHLKEARMLPNLANYTF